ncbi:hypothetical protein [Pontibacter roseus]|uniref:hypothetical protein n=1 Tax=Pontibacter roseus TaxID=336989 RepID=UPI000375ECEB|nr:hypothetical protein [Pontibacter roseus]
MYKLKFLLLWCFMLGAIVSCGDKEDDPEPDATFSLDYLPTTKGNTWNYGGIRPYSFTATGGTKDFDGQTYHELETKAGNETAKSYLHKDKGVYTTIGFVPNSGSVKIVVLKEESAIGKPWEQTNTINGVQTKMSSTIEAKGITKTVEGKTYKDVIHVKMVTTYSFMGIDFDQKITSHYFFAKGVGLILSDIEDYGQVPLLSYTVK